MATLWHFPREIGKERPRSPWVWTSKRLEGSQLWEIRVSSEPRVGKWYPFESKGLGGARGEEAVEWVRKGWRIVAAPALAGVDLGGGGIRIWELKPSKELKRITVARISPGCVCLSAYPSILLYFGLSIRTFVNGFRLFCGHRIAECGFIRLQASAKFLKWKIDENRTIFLNTFSITISLFYCDSKCNEVSPFEREPILKICYMYIFSLYMQ